MTRSTADETVTVRLPRGAAKKLVAATGQPFSRIVRGIVMQLLSNLAAQGRLEEDSRDKMREDIADAVEEATEGREAAKEPK